jgi:peptidoglycan/LPS O-acetylase OafA/YrhL
MVQALRALAAVAVAVHHVTHEANSPSPVDASLAAAIGRMIPWEAGVDVFFVISGFVMLHASEVLFQRGTTGIHRFAAHRIARIVPLYWATMTVFLIVAAVDPRAVAASLGGAGYVLASYAFIPWARPDGQMQPVYGLGWTLNYEMFFYLIFAACLWMPRRRAILCMTLVLAGLAAAGAIVNFPSDILRYWSSPMILEFLLGVWIRALWRRIGLRAQWTRIGLAVVAIAWLHADIGGGTLRIIGWGLPAALLVIAAVSGGETSVSPWTALWVRLGDASYALYLLHPFVMRGVSLIWHRLGFNMSGASIIYIAVSLTLACAAALIVNALVERPATRFVRRRLEPA